MMYKHLGKMVTNHPSTDTVKRKRWVISHSGSLVMPLNSKHYTKNINNTSGLTLSLSCEDIKVFNNRCSLGNRRQKVVMVNEYP